jgi:hypothetical protein
VLEMTEAEVESHIATLKLLSGAKPEGESNTRRFKGHRKKQP